MHNYPCLRDQYIPEYTQAYILFTSMGFTACACAITTDLDSGGSYFTRLFTRAMIHFTAHLRTLALHGFTGEPLWIPA